MTLEKVLHTDSFIVHPDDADAAHHCRPDVDSSDPSQVVLGLQDRAETAVAAPLRHRLDGSCEAAAAAAAATQIISEGLPEAETVCVVDFVFVGADREGVGGGNILVGVQTVSARHSVIVAG